METTVRQRVRDGADRYVGKAEELSRLREKHLVLKSTFEWDPESEEARFWMKKDLANQNFDHGNWCFGILRTDIWRLATTTRSAKKLMRKGRSWKTDGAPNEGH